MKPSDYFDGKSLKLVEAASKGDASEVARLIEEGADPNKFGKQDMIPLAWTAFFAKNKKGVKALLEHGANPNLRFRQDMTPLFLAVKEKDSDYLRIFLEHGGNPNARVSNVHLLLVAADNDHWEHMRLLIDHGADINYRDSVDNTLIYNLTLTNDYEQVYYLLQRGADYSIKTYVGDSAIHRIFNAKVDKGAEAYPWLQKCREWLIARGVKNPGPFQRSKEELEQRDQRVLERLKSKKKP